MDQGKSVARILLVEDDLAILETLSMFLEYEGFSVTAVTDVEAAVAALSSETSGTDLVLLDYWLGQESAEPVVEIARQLHGPGLPVILLTAVDEPRVLAAQLGTHAVVPKPFELDTLLRTIRRQLERARREELLTPSVPLAPPVASSNPDLNFV